MRYQGRITTWKDEQGFGFITPNAGGKQVFVHIKSFSNRQRRPIGSELITYELVIDSKGRPQAKNAAFVGDKARQESLPGPDTGSLIFVMVFLVALTVAVSVGKLPFVVLGLYLVACISTFIAYAWDKSAAIKGRQRTPEATLHIFGLAGGWPGAVLAQNILRHKSKKKSFQITFWVTVALNCFALGWLFTSPGNRILKSLMGVDGG